MVSSGQVWCPVPGGRDLSVTGHRGHVMTWGFLCVLVSWVCLGHPHGDAQLVVGYMGLVFRRKMQPEDMGCMSVPEFSLTHSWRPLFPGSRGAPPALWAASAAQGWQTPSQHTLFPPSLSACAAVQGGGAWDALPGSVPTALRGWCFSQSSHPTPRGTAG